MTMPPTMYWRLLEDKACSATRALAWAHYASTHNIREDWGHNDGPWVRRFLASVGLGPGYAWCAAFMYWCCRQAGYSESQLPVRWKAAGVRHWVKWSEKRGYITNSPQRADLFWWLNKDGTGHIGIIAEVLPDSQRLRTYEGNTDASGSREGDGVYMEYRHLQQLATRHRYGFIRLPRV